MKKTIIQHYEEFLKSSFRGELSQKQKVCLKMAFLAGFTVANEFFTDEMVKLKDEEAEKSLNDLQNEIILTMMNVVIDMKGQGW